MNKIDLSWFQEIDFQEKWQAALNGISTGFTVVKENIEQTIDITQELSKRGYQMVSDNVCTGIAVLNDKIEYVEVTLKPYVDYFTDHVFIGFNFIGVSISDGIVTFDDAIKNGIYYTLTKLGINPDESLVNDVMNSLSLDDLFTSGLFLGIDGICRFIYETLQKIIDFLLENYSPMDDLGGELLETTLPVGIIEHYNGSSNSLYGALGSALSVIPSAAFIDDTRPDEPIAVAPISQFIDNVYRYFETDPTYISVTQEHPNYYWECRVLVSSVTHFRQCEIHGTCYVVDNDTYAPITVGIGQKNYPQGVQCSTLTVNNAQSIASFNYKLTYVGYNNYTENYNSISSVEFNPTPATKSTTTYLGGTNSQFSNYSDAKSNSILISVADIKPYTINNPNNLPDVDPDNPKNPDDYNPVVFNYPVPPIYHPRSVPFPKPDPPTDLIHPVPSPDISGSNEDSFIHIYSPTQTQLDSFNNELWDDNVITLLKKWWNNNPLDGVVTLKKIYIPQNNKLMNSTNIVLGKFTANTQSATVPRITQYNMCTEYLHIAGKYNDYRDYESTVILYLPCVGFQQLDTKDVMYSYIDIDYTTDVITGDTVVNVLVKKEGWSDFVTLYTYSCNVAVEYPLSSGSRDGILSGLVGATGGAISTIGNALMGNVGSAVMSGLGTATSLANSVSANVHSVGAMGGSASMLGIRYPYIIVKFPISEDTHNTDTLSGRITCDNAYVSELSGFNQFKVIHVDTISNATDTEKAEIEQILKTGVIL